MNPTNALLPEVICIGEALIDRLGPVGGDSVLGGPVEDCLGGAPANVACALARLGSKVAFIGCLGDDDIGARFRQLMLKRRVNIQGLQFDPTRPSRVVLVRRDDQGDRSFVGFSGNTGDGFADQGLDPLLVKKVWPLISRNAKWLLIGSIPLASSASSEALLWSVENALKKGISIAFDVNWRPTFWDSSSAPDGGPDQATREAIKMLFEGASLLKLANEEAIWFFDSEDPSFISQSLPKEPDVVITDGAKPVRWLVNGFCGEMEVFKPLSVVDTTGAGDAFTAGLLHRIMQVDGSLKKPALFSDCIRFAAACGALVCGAAGAIEPQPSEDEVLDFLHQLVG